MGWDIQSVTGKQNIYYPFEPKVETSISLFLTISALNQRLGSRD